MKNAAFDQQTGARLRALRKAQGLSLETLGTRVGVTYQQIQKYELGRNQMSANMVVSMARVLGSTPHHILGFEDVGEAEDVQKITADLANLTGPVRENILAGIKGMIDAVRSVNGGHAVSDQAAR